jgi:hypothetical protein
MDASRVVVVHHVVGGGVTGENVRSSGRSRSRRLGRGDGTRGRSGRQGLAAARMCEEESQHRLVSEVRGDSERIEPTRVAIVDVREALIHQEPNGLQVPARARIEKRVGSMRVGCVY